MAPQLTGELLVQGLTAAQAIGNEWARAQVLAALTPQLTGELLVQGLAAAQAIGDERFRANALAALAPQLTGELLMQGLAVAQAIGDERARAQALAALAPFVPDRPAASRHIRHAIADHLWRNLQHQTRAATLIFCADATLFAPPVLDGDTLAAIAGHIVTVCTQWQWP